MAFSPSYAFYFLVLIQAPLSNSHACMDQMPNADFRKSQFGENFLWGVSTAVFQIEGAHDADGKGLSIWDVFTNRKKKIKGDHCVGMACDFTTAIKATLNWYLT